MGFFSNFSLSKWSCLSEDVRGCGRAAELQSPWAWGGTGETLGSAGLRARVLLVQGEGYFSRVLVNTCSSGSWWWCYVQRCPVTALLPSPLVSVMPHGNEHFFKPLQYCIRKTQMS